MFLCQKLSTLGFCYRDGMEGYEKKLNDHDRRCRIKTIPTLVEIISYATYPCTCFVGPSFEYKDYIDFIEGENIYQNIPFHFWEGTFKFLKGIPCFAGVILTGSYITAPDLAKDEFGQHNMLWQFALCAIVLWNLKFSAYSCWFFADGTSIISGFAYGGTDEKGNAKYDRNRAFDFCTIEFGTNPRD